MNEFTCAIIEQINKSQSVCEKPVNKRMLICIACGNSFLNIELSYQKQGGRNYAK